MNLKILKTVVISMGILIILGIIVLCIGIYNKINYMNSNNSSKEKYLVKFEKPFGMKLVSQSINNNNIILVYENDKLIKIKIFDYFKEKIVKEIDLLK
tara:strand:+ start:346 stop:639 length:294 start_codon:yes stop_codon:yes gene_type:complete